MANLKLSLAITSNPRTWPIIDGRVKIDGIDFTQTVLGPAEIFWRQLRFAEFDVSEMSMSELMMIRAARRRPVHRHTGVHDAALLPYRHFRA